MRLHEMPLVSDSPRCHAAKGTFATLSAARGTFAASASGASRASGVFRGSAA
jgi:hypothetical protein